jgi:hypothetical protein
MELEWCSGQQCFPQRNSLHPLFQSKAIFPIKTHTHRAGRVAQVIEHLTSKHEALSSKPNMTKTNKQAKRERNTRLSKNPGSILIELLFPNFNKHSMWPKKRDLSEYRGDCISTASILKPH